MRFPSYTPRAGSTRRTWLGGLLLAALLMSSCSGADEGTEAASADRLDPAVFDGEALTVDGETYDLGQLADSDLVIWFWAPW